MPGLPIRVQKSYEIGPDFLQGSKLGLGPVGDKNKRCSLMSWVIMPVYFSLCVKLGFLLQAVF